MGFELKVALRYLTSSRLQTGLILAGVAVGIVAYTFMAALINGLAVQLTDDVIGNLAHVVLEPLERQPRVFERTDDTVRSLIVVERGVDRRRKIDGWRRRVAVIEGMPGVTDVSPQASGAGFARRGQATQPVSWIGVERDRLTAIVDLERYLIDGDLSLGPEDALIGSGLAEELGLSVGRRFRSVSDRGRERTLVVRGIFRVGSSALDERVVFLSLATAQNLFDLPGAITRIEIHLSDIYKAPELAARLAAATNLEGRDWISDNQRLRDALDAQGRTGSLIKIFSMLTIVIGVASVLLLAALRRRAEIGIMRSFGVSRRSIATIFVLQGSLIGLIGSSLGALGGFLFCRLLAAVVLRSDGSQALPVDPAQGEYVFAVAIATLASAVAAILPARSASKVDPIEVIQQ